MRVRFRAIAAIAAASLALAAVTAAASPQSSHAPTRHMSVSLTAAHALNRAPADPPAPVIQTLPAPVLMTTPPPAATACTSNCRLYLICLSNANTHCLAWNSVDITSIFLSALGAAGTWFPILWKVITNRSGQSTDEAEGTDKGGTDPQPPPPGLSRKCLGDAASPSDGNDRAYITTNCFGNPFTSWEWSSDGKGKYDYFNVNNLIEGKTFGLATLNLRQGAFVYVKPDSQSGTWSTWSWYWAATCIRNC